MSVDFVIVNNVTKSPIKQFVHNIHSCPLFVNRKEDSYGSYGSKTIGDVFTWIEEIKNLPSELGRNA